MEQPPPIIQCFFSSLPALSSCAHSSRCAHAAELLPCVIGCSPWQAAAVRTVAALAPAPLDSSSTGGGSTPTRQQPTTSCASLPDLTVPPNSL